MHGSPVRYLHLWLQLEDSGETQRITRAEEPWWANDALWLTFSLLLRAQAQPLWFPGQDGYKSLLKASLCAFSSSWPQTSPCLSVAQRKGPGKDFPLFDESLLALADIFSSQVTSKSDTYD